MKEDIFVVEGRTIEKVPYEEHPPIRGDSRVPNYCVTTPKIQCCLNCGFAFYNYGLLCGLTLNDRGYFSGVDPFGKCDIYKKGQKINIGININKVFKKNKK